MKNSFRVTFKFSFKGETYAPSCIVDLDAYMERKQTVPQLDFLVARENGIDTYSYLFEVMQQSDMLLDQATGLAMSCCKDNSFDWVGFENQWHQQKLNAQLQAIVDELDVKDSNMNQAILDALMKAYLLGNL